MRQEARVAARPAAPGRRPGPGIDPFACCLSLSEARAPLTSSALRRQRDLYGAKAETVIAETGGALAGGRKHAGPCPANGAGAGQAASSGIKSKWMKAIRTLTSSQGAQSTSPAVSASSSASAAALASDMEKYVQFSRLHDEARSVCFRTTTLWSSNHEASRNALSR